MFTFNQLGAFDNKSVWMVNYYVKTWKRRFVTLKSYNIINLKHTTNCWIYQNYFPITYKRVVFNK